VPFDQVQEGRGLDAGHRPDGGSTDSGNARFTTAPTEPPTVRTSSRRLHSAARGTADRSGGARNTTAAWSMLTGATKAIRDPTPPFGVDAEGGRS
jgi:hypothetical protein